MTINDFDTLRGFIPPSSYSLIDILLRQNSFQLLIVRERTSKLGDFRPPVNMNQPRISVNRNLNKYEFLIVLLHEIAHLIVWRKQKRRVKPHGKEWKNEFASLLEKFIENNSFPIDIKETLEHCINISVFSTMRCEQLNLVLTKYNEEKGYLKLKDIPDNTFFRLKTGKEMLKMKIIRKRYKCKDIVSGSIYSVHPLADIIVEEEV